MAAKFRELSTNVEVIYFMLLFCNLNWADQLQKFLCTMGKLMSYLETHLEKFLRKMTSISSNLIGIILLCFHYQPITYLYVSQVEIIFLLWYNSSCSIRLISRKFSIATMLSSSSSTSSSVGSSLVPLFSWLLNLENRALWLSVSHACLVKIIWSKWSLWVFIHFATSAGLAFQPVLPSSKMSRTNFSQRLVNLVGGFCEDSKTFVKWVKEDSLFLGQAFRKVDLFQSCQVCLSIFYCPDQGHCHQSSQTCWKKNPNIPIWYNDNKISLQGPFTFSLAVTECLFTK